MEVNTVKAKKIISVLLVMLMCISMMAFVGCGESKTETDGDKTDTVEKDTVETGTETADDKNDTADAETETDDKTAETVKVYVTLANAGEIAGAYKEVETEDTDGDGVVSVADAIACGDKAITGSDDGFASAKTEYGTSITKLLGVENGGSYGCYINNTFLQSFDDAVKEGDHIYAYCYKDLTAWTDAYSYFDQTTANTSGELTLKLSYIAFDENYNPVETPVAGAIITIDGEKTDAVTGEDGTVTITVEGSGEHLVSAVSDTMTLVPPVCIVTAG